MKLKVTVAFGTTRVIVPCGDGQVSVRDLTEAAILRYRKATNKPADSWVTVHKLQSLADGGILDPDDALADVVDDKDQILAIYDEQDPVPSTNDVCILPSSTLNNGGDGGSSASLDDASTASPVPVVSNNDLPERPLIAQRPARALSKSVTFPAPAGVENSVEITSLRDPPTSGLTVRQEADRLETNGYSMHSFSRGKRPAPPPPPAFPSSMSEHSGLVLGRSSSVVGTDDGPLSPLDSQLDGGRLSAIGMGKFDRGSARKSRLADKWLDAAEKVWDDRERQEPIGKEQSREPSPTDADTLTLRIGGAAGQPLGIQVAPEYGAGGKLASVSVTQIHEGGRAATDGRLRLADRVVEINNRPVYQMSAVRAQTYLHELTNTVEILLKIVRPIRTNELATSKSTTTTTKKPAQSALQQANTSKIGATKTIDLRKDSRGLGFTVTSRDTASGERLFYIKTVMPQGVALEDGRLKAGDRLLEINGQPVTGLTQRDVVEKLRLLNVGDVVSLLVSRHEDDNPVDHQQTTRPPSAQRVASPSQPRQLPADRVNAGPLDSVGHRQRLAFDIALNDTGSAGLGVSVKGRTELTTEEDQTTKQNDCGIFIKTIMHGGAAHKDGRLHVNDQLIAIDNIDLLNKTNSEAMRLIGQTMQRIGPTATSIRLCVFRAATASQENDTDAQRYALPTTVPTSAEEGESLYLDTLRRNASRLSTTTAASTVPRVTVVGYGDYATVVRNPSDGQEKPMIVDDRAGEYAHPSTARTTVKLYEDIDELNAADRSERAAEEEDHDAFVREAPTRRSMSEKRHLGAKNDPSHTVTYQRIKHQRQTSAPTLAGESALIVSPPESPPTVARFRSSKQVASSNSPQVRRRSISLESMGVQPATTATTPQPAMMIHEIAARSSRTSGGDRKSMGPALKKVQRARPTNDSFRQAVDRSYAGTGKENAIDVNNTSPIPEEPLGISPTMRTNGHHSLPRQAANKDKNRRKSVGSALFSKGWFRFGSGRSREASPEKPTVLSDSEAETRERAKRANEEENARIREQYEKLKKQQTTGINGKHLGPSQNSAPSLRTHGPPLVPRLVPSPRALRREPHAPPLPHAPPPSYYAHHHTPAVNGHAQRMSRVPPYPPMSVQMQPEMLPVSSHGYDGNGYEDYAYAPWFVRAENSRFYRSLDRGGRIPRSDTAWHLPTPPSDDISSTGTLRFTTEESGRLRATSELVSQSELSSRAAPATTTPLTPTSPTRTAARRPLSPSNSLVRRHRHLRQCSTDDSAHRRPSLRPDVSQTRPLHSHTISAATRSSNISSGRVDASRSSSRAAAPELAAVDFDYRRLLRPVNRTPIVKPAPPPPSRTSRPISNFVDYRRPQLPTATPYDWRSMESDAPAYC